MASDALGLQLPKILVSMANGEASGSSSPPEDPQLETMVVERFVTQDHLDSQFYFIYPLYEFPHISPSDPA